MTKLLALACLTSSLCFTACSSSAGGATEIDPGPLTGMVAGQPWSFVAGETDAFLSQDSDNYFATFYASSYTACGFTHPSGPSLIVAVPKVAGDYPMGLMRNMTFVVGSDNKIATDGRIVVASTTGTLVTGGLVGTLDDSNNVSGQFTLTVCPASGAR
ncbi:hypothetical protein BH11MYX1_BH11MYX1_55290 [soil metagenome]